MYYHSLFDQEELEKEKNVILEEIRMYEDTPDEIVHDYFIETVLSGHPLAHPIVGSSASIKGTSRKKLVDFFHDHYYDNNCLFAVAGNFDADLVKREVDKHFSRNAKAEFARNSENKLIETPYAEKQSSESWRHVHRDLEQVHFCVGVEGLNKNDDDRWALYALSTLLGGSMSSRLFQNIREKEGLCYSIYSFHSTYEDTGLFGIYCGTSPDNFYRVFDLILGECARLIDSGVSTDELQDTKSYIKGNIALSLESTEVRMGQLARNEMNYGRYISFQEIVEHIDKIESDDIVRVAKRLLQDKTLTMVSIGNIGKKMKKELEKKQFRI
jgi:predicted Zn-dependent peptidase